MYKTVGAAKGAKLTVGRFLRPAGAFVRAIRHPVTSGAHVNRDN